MARDKSPNLPEPHSFLLGKGIMLMKWPRSCFQAAGYRQGLRATEKARLNRDISLQCVHSCGGEETKKMAVRRPPKVSLPSNSLNSSEWHRHWDTFPASMIQLSCVHLVPVHLEKSSPFHLRTRLCKARAPGCSIAASLAWLTCLSHVLHLHAEFQGMGRL